METSEITIPAIRLKLTGACSRSCFFCHEEGDMRSISTVNPDEHLFECVHTLAEELGIERVMLTGGEPLLLPSIKKIIDGLRVQEISITTNGIHLKSMAEWIELKNVGLTKVIVSIHDASPQRFLGLEVRNHTIDWAIRALSNQLGNLANLYQDGITTRVNTVVYGDYKSTRHVLDTLRDHQVRYRFELRLLNDIFNIERSQDIIYRLCSELEASETKSYRRAGSSNVTRYFQTPDGFTFSVKLAYRYFSDCVCIGCPIKENCREGFYGVRIEKKGEEYFVRLCIYKQSPDVLMPWKLFLSSGLATKLKRELSMR